MSEPARARVIRFAGSIDLGGYKWERREQSMRLRDQGSILDGLVDQEGDYIVSCGGVRQSYILEARRGETVKRYPHNEHFKEVCFPMFELANAKLCKYKKKQAAMNFVRKFGMPNGYHEIELEEFLGLASKYLNVLGSKSLTVDPSPRQAEHIDTDGQASTRAKTFMDFCTLELMELVQLEREFKQCAFCNKWYALVRRGGKGRGGHGADELRFCNYDTNCRQKHAATSI